MLKFAVTSCVVVLGTAAGAALACMPSPNVATNAPQGMTFDYVSCKFVPVGQTPKATQAPIGNGLPKAYDFSKWVKITDKANPYDVFVQSNQPALIEQYRLKQNQVITWPKNHKFTQLDMRKDLGKQGTAGDLAWASQAQPAAVFKGLKSAG